jgi:hypothetical protein
MFAQPTGKPLDPAGISTSGKVLLEEAGSAKHGYTTRVTRQLQPCCSSVSLNGP